MVVRVFSARSRSSKVHSIGRDPIFSWLVRQLDRHITYPTPY
nr:hypothetical protein JVH1_6915 [Rhodococcus sp. JVH1]